MSPAKVAVACGLTAMALLLSACGVKPKPEAGTPHLNKQHGFYGVVDDPRKKHVPCLRADKLPFRQYWTAQGHRPAIQIGSLPGGPTIVFYSTPGIAQGLQLQGQDEGAEAIGSALVYPNGASGTELTQVEDCTAIGVTG
jgi:hypothetical protein